MIKLVVFDFDDTLCQTYKACFTLENQIAQSMGACPVSEELYKTTWGKPLEESIHLRFPGIDSKTFQNRINQMTVELGTCGQFDVISQEVLDLLDQLIKKGKKLAVLTSRTFTEASHLLEVQHPITSRIKAFYHKDNLTYHKPDPRVFNQVLTDFSVKARETVYLGDSVGDAVAAKGAGLHFVAVMESGLRTRDDFKGIDVDWFVDKLTDIMKILN